MKFSKIIILLFVSLFIISCSKTDRQEVKEKMDTASQKLGRELDTLVNTMTYGDSLYKNAPITEPDTSKLSRKTFRADLNDIFDEYSDIKDELADDDTAGVLKQAGEFKDALAKVQKEAASEKLSGSWKLWISSAEKLAAEMAAAKTLEKQREVFGELTSTVESLVKDFGLNDITIYKVSCSTIKTKNSYWLTDSKDNVNPYYGKDKSNDKSKPCIEVKQAWKFN
jgi:hypothetical protein